MIMGKTAITRYFEGPSEMFYLVLSFLGFAHCTSLLACYGSCIGVSADLLQLLYELTNGKVKLRGFFKLSSSWIGLLSAVYSSRYSRRAH